MSGSTRAFVIGAIAGSALFAGLGQALASEPANLGNFLATMGAPIAAAPPPGLFFASTVFYIPMASGNGNADCGAGCKERYNAVGATVNLTWSTGLKFLGADYYPTIQTGGYQAAATTTPYPPGGGVLQSPIYNNVFDHRSPISISIP